MKNKINKIIYYSSTALLSGLMLMSALMAFIDNEASAKSFEELGYPGYISYFLATASILGLIAIWSRRSRLLKEWAYVGFFFTFILAGFAHIVANIGSFIPALIALFLLIVSYIYDKKLSVK